MGTGIKFTKKGWQFFEEEILKTYYDPEKRKEIVKIAKVLEIDIEALKDSVLKKTLGIEKPVRAKMLLITKCRECKHCSSITRADGKHECDITYEDEFKTDRKVIPDPDIIDSIPSWCPLPDAPEEI